MSTRPPTTPLRGSINHHERMLAFSPLVPPTPYRSPYDRNSVFVSFSLPGDPAYLPARSLVRSPRWRTGNGVRLDLVAHRLLTITLVARGWRGLVSHPLFLPHCLSFTASLSVVSRAISFLPPVPTRRRRTYCAHTVCRSNLVSARS
jgi:hypothetical protein